MGGEENVKEFAEFERSGEAQRERAERRLRIRIRFRHTIDLAGAGR
jgi:hypothetical protein